MNEFSLSGKTALVTGANTGLGQGIAVALAGAGAKIVTVGRSAATDTLRIIKEQGREAIEIRADLSNQSAPENIFAEIDDRNISVDVLVNNAGIIKRQDALEFSPDNWDLVLDVNLRSAFFLCQNFAKRRVERGQAGKIINIASMLSYQGGIRVASYTASKSGLMGLTRILANEWAPFGINVNAIAPGYFATNNTQALQNDPRRNEEILSRIPTGRWGQPSDLGGAAVFLASSASDYVQGITLPVDGGWLAR